MKIIHLFCFLLFCQGAYGQKKKAFIAPVSANPSTRAVVLGVSGYQDSLLPALPHTRQDAELFTAFLRSRSGGLLPAHHIQLLTDSDSKLAHFTTALSWLQEESIPGDHIILFYTGHARLLKGEAETKPFLYFYDSPALPVDAGTMSLSSLLQKIQKMCLHYGFTFSLYFNLQVIPEADIGSDLWYEWTHAFESAFAVASAEWTKGRSGRYSSLTQVFLDGSLGAADGNDNDLILPYEMAEYFKRERRSVPKGQTFLMAFSSDTKPVATVPYSSKNSSGTERTKNGQFPSLVGLEVTNLEDSLLSQANEQTRKWYNDFIITLKLGKLMYPEHRCASDLYDSLLQQPALEPLHSHWRRKLAASLLDETQQGLNAYLKTDTREVFRRWRHADQYELYPLYMDRALQLLGRKNFMYPILMTKLHYFEGLKARLDGEKYGDHDFYKMARSDQHSALSYEPEAAFVWNELGVVYSLLENDSAEYCYLQATRTSPSWGFPYSNLAWFYQEKGMLDKALIYAEEAIKLAPGNVIGLNILGTIHLQAGRFEDAESTFRRAIALDITYDGSYYNLCCTKSLQGDQEAAGYWLEMAIGKGYNNWEHIHQDPDLENFRKSVQYIVIQEKFNKR